MIPEHQCKQLKEPSLQWHFPKIWVRSNCQTLTVLRALLAVLWLLTSEQQAEAANFLIDGSNSVIRSAGCIITSAWPLVKRRGSVRLKLVPTLQQPLLKAMQPLLKAMQPLLKAKQPLL